MDKPMSFVNIINIDEVFADGTKKYGLAHIVKQVFKKEFSKYNQQSNWDKRPLRKSQIHYAALDAVATLQLLLQIRKEGSPYVEQIEPQSYNSSAKVSPDKDKGVIVQNVEQLEQCKIDKNYRFLVDGMLKKLASNLRNIGLDAVMAQETMKPKEIVQLAEAEDRIILTRDRKVMDCKKTKPLIKIISSDAFMQLTQVVDLLNIKVTNKDLLSRCVKCNAKEIECIGFEEAQKELKWENEETNTIKDFWRCMECKQIYWEGGTFDKAKKMFAKLINSTQDKPSNEPATMDIEEPEEVAEDDEDDNGTPYSKIKKHITESEKEVIEDDVLKDIQELLEYK